MDISGAIALAGETIKLVKGLKDIDHALDKSELKGNMAQLYSDLADVKMALVDAQTELRQKDEEIAQLRSAQDFSDDLVTVKGYKFQTNAAGEPIGGAFCPLCEQKQRIFVRLTPAPRTDKDRGAQVCPNCKSRFGYPVPTFNWPSEEGEQ